MQINAVTSDIAAAIDWGGTKLLAGLVSRDGQVICARQIPTPQTTPEAVLDAASGIVEALLSEQGLVAAALAGIGVSAPGVVDAQTGTLVFAPATGWRNVDIRGSLTARFARQVSVANDVDNCMRAERRVGAAQSGKTSVWMTVSTGVGGCIVHDGHILGGRGAAGEVGHIVVEEDGPLCGCGNRGCLEAVAAGPAILRRAQAHGLAVDSAQALARLAAAGDAVAAQYFTEASQAIGRAVGAIINIIDPDSIVFGGGVAASLDLSVIGQVALQRSIRVNPTPPEFLLTRLGANASLIGAGLFTFERQNHAPLQ